jgi:hypothetical protein
MNFTITTDTEVADGTALRGYVKGTLETLIKKLGEPIRDHSGDGKVTCEWILQFDEDTVATIYDWKLSEIPSGDYLWHIGGKGHRVVEKVGFVLGLPTIHQTI